jgi:hypothetical protein
MVRFLDNINAFNEHRIALKINTSQKRTDFDDEFFSTLKFTDEHLRKITDFVTKANTLKESLFLQNMTEEDRKAAKDKKCLEDPKSCETAFEKSNAKVDKFLKEGNN